MALEKLYSVEEVAEMTAVTTRTIRNYLRKGVLTGTKIGGQWRFRQEDIMHMFNQEKNASDFPRNQQPHRSRLSGRTV